MNNLMSSIITYVPNVRKPQEFEEIPLKKALMRIKKGRYSDDIDAARLDLLNGDVDAYKLKKNALPSYAFHGTFEGSVVNADFNQSSGLIQFDIDNLKAKKLSTIRKKLSEDPHTAFVFTSPSAKGLKGAVRVDPNFITDDSTFKIAFAQISKYWAERDVLFDASCKDVRRLCFVSDDPKIYYNLDPQVFPLMKTRLNKILRDPGKKTKKCISNTTDSKYAVLSDITLENAGSYLPPAGDQSYQEWRDVGMALHHQFDGSDQALVIFDTWSQGVREYKGYDDVEKAWVGFGKRTAGPIITFRSVIRAHKKQVTCQNPSGELCLQDEWQDNLKMHVEKLNQSHAQVFVGGKHYIMRVVPKGVGINNRISYEFIRRSEIELMYGNTAIKVGEKNGGRGVRDIFKNHIEAWVKHPDCRTFRGGVLFKPKGKVPEGYLNTWQGFAVKPKEGSMNCALIMLHIKDVICDGNTKLFEYFLNWVAYTLQHPERPAKAALVLRGEKGSGKGILGHFLRHLWGNHALHISNARHLVGNFNAHLADVCFLFADEAFFSGDKQHEGVLKTLITEPIFMIERKGIDATNQKNFLKVFMVTNSKYAVPASKDERRYCVFDVSSEKIGDNAYFDKLRRDCKDQDVQAAFLYEMLNRDISKFRTSKIPESDGLKEQRLHSLPSVSKWLADSLSNGYFAKDKEGEFGSDEDWKNEVSSSDLYASYLNYCNKLRIGEYNRDTQIVFSKYLKEIYKKKQLGHARHQGFEFGTLKEAIRQFERYEKVKLSVRK
jgi:hypothetical protein